MQDLGQKNDFNKLIVLIILIKLIILRMKVPQNVL